MRSRGDLAVAVVLPGPAIRRPVQRSLSAEAHQQLHGVLAVVWLGEVSECGASGLAPACLGAAWSGASPRQRRGRGASQGNRLSPLDRGREHVLAAAPVG